MVISRSALLYVAVIASTSLSNVRAFTPFRSKPVASTKDKGLQLGSLENLIGSKIAASASRFCKARELVKSLIEEEKCFSTEAGAMEFGEVCAANIVYEDCFEPQPFVGKMVRIYESSDLSMDALIKRRLMSAIYSTGSNKSHAGESSSAKGTWRCSYRQN
jgi:hypothetical protein